MQRVVTAWVFCGQIGSAKRRHDSRCVMDKPWLKIFSTFVMGVGAGISGVRLGLASDRGACTRRRPPKLCFRLHPSFQQPLLRKIVMICEICAATTHIQQHGSEIGKCWGRHFIDILEPVLGSLYWILCNCMVWQRCFFCLASNISLCAKEHYSCCHSRCSQASEGVMPCNSDLNKHWWWADGDVIAWSQVAFAMEKAAVLDLLAAKWHPGPALSVVVPSLGLKPIQLARSMLAWALHARCDTGEPRTTWSR